MSLRVWIGGPRFGESIVLSWRESEKGAVAAVIDNHGSLAEGRLLQLGNPSLKFVAATHPHYDHILNLGQIMEGEQPDAVHWWGEDSEVHEMRCLQLTDRLAHPAASVAEQCGDFFDAAQACGHGPLPMSEPGMLLYETTDETGTVLRIWALGPWPESRSGYLKSFHDQFPGAEVRPHSVSANRTSLGFLVTYGEAQAVLGGDMEKQNWRDFAGGWAEVQQNAKDKAEPVPPKVTPALVKVSHHGSNTGHTDGMWQAGEGWFGTGTKPWCVVTPWCFPTAGENPYRTLPDKDTLNLLHAAGGKVVLTGTPNKKLELTLAEVEACMVLNESFVEFEMLSDGKVEMVQADKVEVLTGLV